MSALQARDLDELFDAALAFGTDWRRPLGDLAAERLPDRPRQVRDALVTAVGEARAAIEEHVGEQHLRLAGRWTGAEEQQADAWIAERYPWMTGQNRRRALGQGRYYAWRDGG